MSDFRAPEHSRVGQFTEAPLDGGPVLTRDVVCCCHCGFMWQYQPGSGRIRGFCTRCNGLCCGRPSCNVTGCVSRWQQLDNMEAGRPLDFRPIMVRAGGN